MVKECVICGNERRTGRKYCHKCRSIGRSGSRKSNEAGGMIILLFVLFTIGAILVWLIKKILIFLNNVLLWFQNNMWIIYSLGIVIVLGAFLWLWWKLK